MRSMQKRIKKHNKMKKYLLFLLMILASFSFACAQNGNGQRSEKIQALKIAFISQRLHLNSTEAEKFWPVYNGYQNEIRQLRSNKSDDVLENEQKLLDIRKKYKPSFEKILGPQRLNDLYSAEKDFRNVLIRSLKEQKPQR